jgi:hypothetical protein
MIEYLEALTFAWLTVCMVVAVRRLRKGCVSTILLTFLVFYILFGLPLGCDLMFGIPGYSQQPGFFYASQDVTVRTVYCCFVCLVPLIWARFVTRTNISRLRPGARSVELRRLRLPLFLLLVSPVIAVLFSPDRGLYLNYGLVASEQPGDPGSAFHSVVMASTFLATLAGAGIVVTAKRVWNSLTFVLPFMAVAVWLNGKRAVVAMALVMLLTALWLTGKLRGRRIVIAIAVALVIVSLFSYGYQLRVRQIGIETRATEDLYENFRIDYARDSRVKMALFEELYPSTPILDYRGESVLFDLTAWIPRKLWPAKPYPYSLYFTSAMLGSLPADRGWGMTTSIFDEAIANFSWPGLLIAPFLIGWMCRLGESSRDAFVTLLTAIIASLLLAVELVAFAPLFVLWLIFLIGTKISFVERRHFTADNLHFELRSQPASEAR